MNFQLSSLKKAKTAIFICITAALCGFSILEGAWTPPFTLGSFNGTILPRSSIAETPSGKAVAIFIQQNGTNITLKGSSFNGTTWNPTTDLSTANFIGDPMVRIDPSGNAFAVWIEIDQGSGIFTIKGAKLLANTLNWLPTSDLDTSSTGFLNPQIAVDSSGNAVAIWDDSGPKILKGATLIAPSLIWTSTTDLTTVGDNFEPAQTHNVLQGLAVNDNGLAVAVWDGKDSITNLSRISGATLQIDSSLVWSTLPITPFLCSDVFVNPAIAVGIDNAGNAYALWGILTLFGASKVQSATLSFGDIAWQIFPDVEIGAGFDLFTSPYIAVAPSGQAVGIWQTENANPVLHGASLASGGTAWQRTADLGPVDPGNNRQFIGIDAAGNALAISNTNFIVNVQTLLSGASTWSSRTPISIPNNKSEATQITVPPSGLLPFALWQDETLGVYQVSQFIVTPPPPPAPPLPPATFTGRVLKNKFLTQTDRIHELNWTASPSPNVVKYNLRRNGVLIATISANQPFIFVDHDRDRKDKYVLTAVDNIGQESTPLFVTLK